MERQFRKVLIEGDEDSKINIICSTLHEGLRISLKEYYDTHKRDIVLMNCEGVAYIDFEKGPIEIYSPYMPYGAAVFMNLDDMGIKDKTCYGEYDEIIFIQPFPFALADAPDKLIDSIDNNPENVGKKYKIMLYRNVDKIGAGGLVGIDEAVEQAYGQIKDHLAQNGGQMIADAVELCEYTEPMDLIKILHGGCGDLRMPSLKLCEKKLDSFSESLENFKEEWGEYKYILLDYGRLTDVLEINRITTFDAVKGCPNIIERYVYNYINKFKNDIMELVEKVYCKTVGDICFWDMDKDIGNLQKGAEDCIRQGLLKLKDGKGGNMGCPAAEAEYNNVRNEHKMDVRFCEEAVSLIKDGLMNYMYEYLKRKEGLLSEAFKAARDEMQSVTDRL